MYKQDNRRIIERMNDILEVLEKMAGDTKTLQEAMRTQEDMIRGDNIMNETMELLREINMTVEKMKKRTEVVAESVRGGATDIRQSQRKHSNNIQTI